MEKYAYTAASIPIYILIIISLFVRHTIHGKVNHIFMLLNFVSLGVALVDFIDGTLLYNAITSEIELFFSFNLISIYFLLRNSTLPIYLIFLLVYMRQDHWLKKKWVNIILWLPVLYVLTLLIINPFNNIVFSLKVNPSNGISYSREKWVISFYVISGAYSVAILSVLAKTFRRVTVSKFLCLFSVIVMTIIAIVVQAIFPNLSIEIFSTALSFLCIAFFVIRPEEVTNLRFELPSFQAYEDGLKKISSGSRNVQIQIIRLLNINNVIAYFGEQEFLRCVKLIASSMVTELYRVKIFSEVYVEEPGTLYLVINDTELDVEKSFYYLRDKLIRSSSQNRALASMDVVSTSIKVPSEISDLEGILRLGHSFHKFMPKGVLYYPGNKIIASQDYEIDTKLPEILRDAINEHHFEMYYQPIYHISQGKFFTAEALIRLKNPHFGFISPAFFIPAAEKRNLLHPIGEFVLDEVFRFAGSEDFKRLGLHYIELNLSVQQIVDPELVDQIKECQTRYHVDPKNINFEITESVYEQTNEIFKRNLETLTEMGYTFSLDDYGTGYSNIHRVIHLPLDIIKIDKSMVDASDSSAGKHIIADSIGMMKNINKTVVIEGVETKEKLDEMTKMGAEMIQGYYFSKPIPLRQFIEFIQQSNA